MERNIPRVSYEKLLLASNALVADDGCEEVKECISVAFSRFNAVVISGIDSNALHQCTSLAGLPLADSLQLYRNRNRNRNHNNNNPSNNYNEVHFLANGPNFTIHEVKDSYAELDHMARLVIRRLAASSHLRLRPETFDSILDEIPLSRNTTGSSTLTVRQHYHPDTSPSSASDDNDEEEQYQPPSLTMMPDPHLPTTDPGLVTLYWATETVDTEGRPMSGIQVKSATGTWQNVSLKPDEVLVMLGTSMQQATAGAVSPTVYRVIGIPSPLVTAAAAPTSNPAVTFINGKDYEIKSYRAVVKFELRPISSAVFNFSKALQQVGHVIPRKYNSGDLKCMKDMMDDFDNMALRRAVTIVPVADDCDDDAVRKPNGGGVSKRRSNVALDDLQMEEKEKKNSTGGDNDDVGNKGKPSSHRRRSGRLSNRQPIDYNLNRQNKRRKSTQGNDDDDDDDDVVVMEDEDEEEAAAAVGEEAAMQLTNKNKGVQKQPLRTKNNNKIEHQHPVGVQRRLSGALVAQQQQQHGDAKNWPSNSLAKDAKQEQPAAGKSTRQAPISPASSNKNKNNSNNNTKLICFAHDTTLPDWIYLKIGPQSVYVYKDALVPIDPSNTIFPNNTANDRIAVYKIRPNLWDSTTHQFKLITIRIIRCPNSEAAFLAPTNTIQAGVLFEKYCSEIVGAPIGCLEFFEMDHGNNSNGSNGRIYGGDVLKCRTVRASVAGCWKGKGMGALTGLLGGDGHDVVDSFYEPLDF